MVADVERPFVGWHAHGCSRGHVFNRRARRLSGFSRDRRSNMAALRLTMAPVEPRAGTVVHLVVDGGLQEQHAVEDHP